MWQYNYTNELYHHGILGMKWGIRRFQNKDGSLTSAGKKRAQQNADEDYGEKTNKPAKKSVKDMSDSELREALNRQRMEREYLDLNRQLSDLNKQKVSAGKRFISYIGNNVIKPAATEAAKNTLSKFAQDKISKLLGLDKEDTLASLKNESEKLRLKRSIEENKDWFKDRNEDTTSNKTSETKTESANKTESNSKTKSERTNSKSSSSNTKTKTKTETKSEGPMTGTVFGEGTSRKSSSSNTKTDNSWWKSKTYYTDDFRDISNKGKSYYNSSTNSSFMNNSTNSSYVSNLASEGKNYFPPYLLESAK